MYSDEIEFTTVEVLRSLWRWISSYNSCYLIKTGINPTIGQWFIHSIPPLPHSTHKPYHSSARNDANMFPGHRNTEHALRFRSSRQLQYSLIESAKGAQLVTLGCRLSGLAHDQSDGEVRFRRAICLQSVPDHLVILKAQVGILQQFIDQIDQVRPGRAVPTTG